MAKFIKRKNSYMEIEKILASYFLKTNRENHSGELLVDPGYKFNFTYISKLFPDIGDNCFTKCNSLSSAICNSIKEEVFKYGCNEIIKNHEKNYVTSDLNLVKKFMSPKESGLLEEWTKKNYNLSLQELLFVSSNLERASTILKKKFYENIYTKIFYNYENGNCTIYKIRSFFINFYNKYNNTNAYRSELYANRRNSSSPKYPNFDRAAADAGLGTLPSELLNEENVSLHNCFYFMALNSAFRYSHNKAMNYNVFYEMEIEDYREKTVNIFHYPSSKNAVIEAIKNMK